MFNAISKKSAIAAIAIGVSTQAQATPVDITVNYTNPVSAGIEAAMDTATAIWEYLLPSYSSTPRDLTGSNIPNPLEIQATFEVIDGPGNILGSAGPQTIVVSDDFNEIYSHTGQMRFDMADLTGGTFVEGVTLFMHEMAHVLGYGTLWDVELGSVSYDLTDGTGGPSSTEYTGANALAAYQAEVDPSATFIPLEDGGGAGTAGGHWDEAAIGLSSVPGDFFGQELMSGIFFSGPSAFISETTVASFADIGYNTIENYSALTIDELIAIVSAPTPVPLPAGGLLLIAGIGGLGLMGRRSSKKAA